MSSFLWFHWKNVISKFRQKPPHYLKRYSNYSTLYIYVRVSILSFIRTFLCQVWLTWGHVCNVVNVLELFEHPEKCFVPRWVIISPQRRFQNSSMTFALKWKEKNPSSEFTRAGTCKELSENVYEKPSFIHICNTE